MDNIDNLDTGSLGGVKKFISSMDKYGIRSDLTRKLKEQLSAIPRAPIPKDPSFTESMHIDYPPDRPGQTISSVAYDLPHHSKHITYSLDYIVRSNAAAASAYAAAAKKTVGTMQDNLKHAASIYKKIAEKTSDRNLDVVSFNNAFKQSQKGYNNFANMHEKVGSSYVPIGSKHNRFATKHFKYSEEELPGNPVDEQLSRILRTRTRNH